jgi:hypothetical protein
MRQVLQARESQVGAKKLFRKFTTFCQTTDWQQAGCGGATAANAMQTLLQMPACMRRPRAASSLRRCAGSCLPHVEAVPGNGNTAGAAPASACGGPSSIVCSFLRKHKGLMLLMLSFVMKGSDMPCTISEEPCPYAFAAHSTTAPYTGEMDGAAAARTLAACCCCPAVTAEVVTAGKRLLSAALLLFRAGEAPRLR